MDSFKCTIIKANEIVITDKSVPLSVYDELADVEPASGVTRAVDENQLTEAEEIKRESERQIKKLREEYYKKGFADGVEKQKKEAASALDAITSLLKKVSTTREEILKNTEEQVLNLVFAITEKIISQEVTVRKDIVLGVLKKALKNISETEGMKIRLNPQDFRYMMEMKKDFLQSFDGIRNVTFEEDTAVKRGGAVIETMFGEVDARLESQLKEIKAAMLQP